MNTILLPFEFSRESGYVLLSNESGDFIHLTEKDFDHLIKHEFSQISETAFHTLYSRHFVCDKQDVDFTINLIANKYRTRKAFLRDFTVLHMMVITLKCNHSCQYCQVSSANADAIKYDMSSETARKVVEMILQAPSRSIKIEFQGGEPLLNWSVIMQTVEYAEKLNEAYQKNISFVICSNIYALNQDHLDYFKAHNIHISTSLDGPKILHDTHRPMRVKRLSSYDKFIENLDWARKELGRDKVSALMTTCSESLSQIKSIVDEYVKLGFEGLFIRSLNPYGDAIKNRLYYSPESFFEMYKTGLEYIVELNQKGVFFVEYLTELLWKRIMTPYPTGFVDLQSPSGAGISGVIYDYNGDVYPADEGRMLARMGNTHFKLGNVYSNSYDSIFDGELMHSIVKDSCIETIPGCSDCVYRPYCGVDVFRNYLENGRVDAVAPDSFFCKKQKLIFRYLFEKMNDGNFVKILNSWIH